jgi:hypothetical protein
MQAAFDKPNRKPESALTGHKSDSQSSLSPSRQHGNSIGNLQIQRMCSECAKNHTHVQPSDDPLEREADEVANRVMRKEAAPSSIGSVPSSGPKSTPQFSAEAQSKVSSVVSSSGAPLDRTTRSELEPRLGQDFGHVRVHHDAVAADSAKSVNAHAYTSGNHIVFASGKYIPQTREGQRLLAHELAHVIQQGNSVSGAPFDPSFAPIQRVPADENPSTEAPVSPENDLCIPISWLFGEQLARAPGAYAEAMIFKDYCQNMSCPGTTEYFDNASAGPIDINYPAFIIAHNALPSWKEVFLSFAQVRRPDIMNHRPDIQEFYEIKPRSPAGIAAGIGKLLDIAAYVKLLGLPYVLGTVYTPTIRIEIWSGLVLGEPMNVQFRVERIAPGLIVYDICIGGNLKEILEKITFAALMAAVIVLILRGGRSMPLPETAPVLASATGVGEESHPEIS